MWMCAQTKRESGDELNERASERGAHRFAPSLPRPTPPVHGVPQLLLGC